jgi:hypothetical protein
MAGFEPVFFSQSFWYGSNSFKQPDIYYPGGTAMTTNPTCRCGADHHSHLCMLKSNGLYDEIAKVSSDPKFYCFTCGGEAHCADNLCEPAPIE